MNDATGKMAEGLRQAIDGEVDGYHFYMMAANTTSDEKGKEVFKKLAHDEVEHANFLRAQYDALMKTGKGDPEVKLGEQTQLSGEHPIFSEDLNARTKAPNYEMSALSIGAQLELQAIQFYQEQADAAEDETIRAFFLELASWEKGHYDALTRQLDNLRSEHWDRDSFSPF
jgi:rubrerythrin